MRSGLIKPPFGRLSSRIVVLTGGGVAAADSSYNPWRTICPGRAGAVSPRFRGACEAALLAADAHPCGTGCLHSNACDRLPVSGEAHCYRGYSACIQQHHLLRNAPQEFHRRGDRAPDRCFCWVVPGSGAATAALRTDTWYATATGSGLVFTAAGWWYGFISIPIFQFILLRWYYRLFIWLRFLFQTARLDLNLLPTHPDRCGGLAFLGNVSFAFAPLLMAHSALLSGFLANRIVHEGAKLPDFKIEVAAVAVLLLAIVLIPLCFFAPKLHHARLGGLRIYGRLASEYVCDFANKWTVSAIPPSEPLLGTADIQSLADLDNSFSIVREMRVVPFNKESVIQFLVVIAIPLAPLALTMFSFEELVKRLIRVIL